MSGVASAAVDYAARGFPVLPLKPGSKAPATSHGKNDASTDAGQIAAWFPADTNRNLGILTGDRSGLIVVDIDPRNDGVAGFERLERTYGKLPETMQAKTGGGGRHLYFSVPPNTDGLSDRPNVGSFRGVDVKAGGYVVAAPSVHESGNAYSWDGDAPVAPAPFWLIDLARGGSRIKSAALPSKGGIEEGSRNDALFRMASGLRGRGLCPEAILAAVQAENIARCIPPLDPDEVARMVEGIVYRYEAGADHADTDLGNARRLVDLMDGAARYEPASGAWFHWNDRCWSCDKDGHVTLLAKRVADGLLAAARLVNDPETLKRRVAFAHRSQSASRIAAMVELAKTEPGVPIAFDAFDRRPDLLNAANGLIDLRTGSLLPHDRATFATQIIDTDYDPAATCPTFERFVADVLGHDAELIAYVQRAIGYAATGETREQCFFVLHGEGANGKSTFLNAIRAVLGSYAKHTPTDTLIAKTGGASNDLARLAGARFVTASEANADQRLADALLKQLTGDEPIVARFLFREFISFRPSFKLFLATNQLPMVNGNDPAIWRRIRTIPFTRVFNPEEQDRELADKLFIERQGILAWIVRGAVDWYREGLRTPAAVRAANDDYRAEMDTVGQFIDERCDVAPGADVSASALYASYRHHSSDSGRASVNPTVFGRTLSTRGFAAVKRGGSKYRVGLKLRQSL